MRITDLFAAFAVTVAGGLTVWLIRRNLENGPVSTAGLIPSAAQESESEIYA